MLVPRALQTCLLAISVLATSSSSSADPPIQSDGTWLRDGAGRIAILHGINVAHKRAPYLPSEEQFGAADAAAIRALGFNSVRLCIFWNGVEPERGQYNEAYLDRLEEIIDLLAEHQIGVLLDVHQDLYTERFGGEGFPEWSVDNWGLGGGVVNPWVLGYLQLGVQASFQSFYWNFHGFQDAFVAMWCHLAERFGEKPNLLGYEFLNEPGAGIFFWDGTWARQQMESFYARLVPAIREVDPDTPIFFENVSGSADPGSTIQSIEGEQLVFSTHIYCVVLYQVFLPWAITWPTSCEDTLSTMVADGLGIAADLGTPMVMTEFGSTDLVDEVAAIAQLGEVHFLGWMYWNWKYWDDPTGFIQEPLVEGDGAQLAFTNVEKALELARIYAERIAGIPVMTSFDPDTTAFDLVFAPDATINAPTMIRIPWHIDAKALDIEVTGGTAELSPSQRHVRVFPSKGAKLVTVSIR